MINGGEQEIDVSSSDSHRPLASKRVDSEGRLKFDLRCDGCGYNLRGLDPRTSCPECGLRIADSLHRYKSRPEWRGLPDFVAFIAVLAGLLLPWINLIRYHQSGDQSSMMPHEVLEVFLVTWVGFGAACLVSLVGVSAIAAYSRRRLRFSCGLILILAIIESVIALVINGLLWVAIISSI